MRTRAQEVSFLRPGRICPQFPRIQFGMRKQGSNGGVNCYQVAKANFCELWDHFFFKFHCRE